MGAARHEPNRIVLTNQVKSNVLVSLRSQIDNLVHSPEIRVAVLRIWRGIVWGALAPLFLPLVCVQFAYTDIFLLAVAYTMVLRMLGYAPLGALWALLG